MMKKILITVLLAAGVASACSAQSTAEEAYALYKAKDYGASAEMFGKAFKSNGGSASDHYNAACSWALAGKKGKAFSHLRTAFAKGWRNIGHLKQDSDLNSLHADRRWDKLVSQLQAAVDKAEANYNKPLKARLEEIYVTDQQYRQMMDSVQTNYGMESGQWESLIEKMEAQDEKNQKEVIAILEKFGWPGKSMVGEQAGSAVFLVLQHADLATQEKYLPLMREAVAKGDAGKPDLALLEDRVLMRNNKPQLYGSQLQMNAKTQQYEFYPILDEAHVDERRAKMGLEPLRNYAKCFNLNYTPPKVNKGPHNE